MAELKWRHRAPRAHTCGGRTLNLRFGEQDSPQAPPPGRGVASAPVPAHPGVGRARRGEGRGRSVVRRRPGGGWGGGMPRPSVSSSPRAAVAPSWRQTCAGQCDAAERR